MRCRSCECEIPPAFVTALATNICPGCGGSIMSETDKELMDGLAEAFERMPNDAQGVAGWLLSNYRLVKIGEKAEPVERFHRPIEKQEQSNKFAARTGYTPNPSLAEKMQQLRNNPKMATVASFIQNDEEEIVEEVLPDEEALQEDIEAAIALKRELGGKGAGIIKSPQELANIVKMGGQKPQRPRVDPIEYDDYEEGNGYITEHERLLQSSPQGRLLLDKERTKRIQAQEAILGGGGAFKRS